jgi:hypothetical protein
LKSFRLPPLTRLFGAALALSLAGCTPDARTLHDYSIAIPADWSPWSGESLAVPGKTLEAYRVPCPGGGEGSLVVFRSSYQPGIDAQQLLVQRRSLFVNVPTVTIHEAKATSIGGNPAVRIDVSAAGIGSALSPAGLGKPQPPPGKVQSPTRRIWIAVLRGRELGTLEVMFHCPEERFQSVTNVVEELLRSFRA